MLRWSEPARSGWLVASGALIALGNLPLSVGADGVARWWAVVAGVTGLGVAALALANRIEVTDAGVRARPLGRLQPWSSIAGFVADSAGVGFVVRVVRNDRRRSYVLTPLISRARARALAERLDAERAS